MPFARQYFLNKIPAGANVNTIRAGSPVLTKAVAVSPIRGPMLHLRVPELPVRGGSTHQPEYLGADPIHQLLASNNPRPFHLERHSGKMRPGASADWHADKAGDFHGIVDSIEVVRLHPMEQAKRRNVHKRAIENAILAQSSRAVLGMGITGHAIAAAPRVKPQLRWGRNDLPADVVPHTFVTSYLQTQMPVFVPARLRAEALTAAVEDDGPLPYGTQAQLALTLEPEIRPTSSVPSEDLKTSGGRLLFLVAAVAVAFWVIAGASK